MASTLDSELPRNTIPGRRAADKTRKFLISFENIFSQRRFSNVQALKIISVVLNFWSKNSRKSTHVTTMSADTDLLQGNLQVVVQVQGLKQVLRAALEPHKQVTWRDSLLEAQQLDVKDQHSTAGNPSG